MGVVHAKEGIPHHKINYKSCDVEARHSEEGVTEVVLDAVKARVDRVHVEGLARTKDDIIQDAVKELFTATDFQDVLLKAHQVRLKLDSLGCFRNIAVFIDTSKGSKATPDGLEVTYHVKEFKRITGGVSTEVGNNEGNLVVGLRAPNILGRGERVQAEYSYGSRRSNNFNVAFIKPFRGVHNPIFTGSLYQASSEWPPSGYRQLDQGVLLDIGFNSYPLLKHNLQWDVAKREYYTLSRSSAFDIREQTGVNLKSALRHILSLDLRDELIFPTCGNLVKVTSEVAGLGGDVGFIKNEVYLQSNYSLLSDFVLQATLNAGVMSEISDNLKIGLSDMFYVGGPLSVRGFQHRGLGPQAETNALGSMTYWAGGLHLFTPLPFNPGKGGFGELFRTHFFVNAGNVLQKGDERDIAEQLYSNMRLSYGIGIAIRLGQMARVEVNYCFPHSFNEADRVQPGVQFGVGVQFL